MPFGAFLALARVAVAAGLGGGDAQVHHLAAVLERPHFRVAAQIADEDHLVDRTRHVAPLLIPSLPEDCAGMVDKTSTRAPGSPQPAGCRGGMLRPSAGDCR